MPLPRLLVIVAEGGEAIALNVGIYSSGSLRLEWIDTRDVWIEVY